MEEDKLLTVIIPVKDRPSYTKRMLDFYNQISFPFRMIVADGGLDNSVMDIVETNKYKNLNLSYVRFPFDETYDNYVRKILSAIELVKTKYVVLGDDDNFFSSEGLATSVRFLEENHSWSSCQGKTIGFRLASSPSRNKIRFSVPLEQYSLRDLSANARLARCVEKNFSTFYAIQRKQDLEKSFVEMVSTKLNDLWFFEAFLHARLIINGRHKSIDVPYMFRQFDVYRSSNDVMDELYGDNFDRMFIDTFYPQYNYFCMSLAASLALAEEISLDDASIIAHNFIKKLLAPSILLNIQQKQTKMPLLLCRLSRLLQRTYRTPSWVSWTVKRNYGVYRTEVNKVRCFLATYF